MEAGGFEALNFICFDQWKDIFSNGSCKSMVIGYERLSRNSIICVPLIRFIINILKN